MYPLLQNPEENLYFIYVVLRIAIQLQNDDHNIIGIDASMDVWTKWTSWLIIP